MIEECFESGILLDLSIFPHPDGKGSIVWQKILADTAQYGEVTHSVGNALTQEEAKQKYMDHPDWELVQDEINDNGKRQIDFKRIKNHKYARLTICADKDKFEIYREWLLEEHWNETGIIRVPIIQNEVWNSQVNWAECGLRGCGIIEDIKLNPQAFNKIIIEKWHPIYYMLFNKLVKWMGCWTPVKKESEDNEQKNRTD